MLFPKWPLYDRVLCNLVNGNAIDGLLIDRRGPLLVLSDAVLHTEGGQPVALDGEIYIERQQVLYLQTAPPRGG